VPLWIRDLLWDEAKGMTMASNRKTAQRAPDFASLEEEAEFWERNSPLDYPLDWREVEGRKAPEPLGHILGVRLVRL